MSKIVKSTVPPCDLCGNEGAGLIQVATKPPYKRHKRTAATTWQSIAIAPFMTVCGDCDTLDNDHISEDAKMLEKYSRPGRKFRHKRKAAK